MRRSIRWAAGGAAGERQFGNASAESRRCRGRPNAHASSSNMTAKCAATLLVCVTCKSDEGQVGAALYEALGARMAAEAIALEPVECLSVCKRPCTVALAAPGKWTYVVGDLSREANIEDIVTAARRYAAAPDGIVPWRERPLPFRKGVVSRTPPLPALSR